MYRESCVSLFLPFKMSSDFYTAIHSSISHIDGELRILSFLDQSMDDNSCLYVSCVPTEIFHNAKIMKNLEEYMIDVFASHGVRAVATRRESASYCVDWCGSRHRTYNVPYHIAFRLEQREVVSRTYIPYSIERPWTYRILSYDDYKPRGSCVRYERYDVVVAFTDEIDRRVEEHVFRINAFLYTGLA
jgi:hypothetical protein